MTTGYPLGIDNPIAVKAVMGTTNWALYWRDDFTKIATFKSQFTAYQMRQEILKCGTNGYRYQWT